MSDIYLPSILYQCVSCLSILIGLGAGVYLITRRHTTPGLLGLGGFLILGAGPLLSFLFYGPLALVNSLGMDFETLNWVTTCISGGALLLGSILIATALIMAIRPSAEDEG